MKSKENKSKKSVFVDNNRFRNGCFCTTMCKACTCFKVDVITTPVGSLKIIELVILLRKNKTIFWWHCKCLQILGTACLLLISHHDAAFFNNQRLTSSVMLFLCPTSVHNGAVLLICYMFSIKTFSMVRPSLFVSFFFIQKKLKTNRIAH